MTFKAWAKSRISRRRPGIPELPKRGSVLTGIDPRLKQRAYDRLAILREYQLRLSKLGRFKTKTKIMQIFLADLNSGVLWPDGTRSIRHVSRGSLYNWLELYRNGGIAALVPRYSGHKKTLSPERAIFKPLVNPFELRFPGPPKRKGKLLFIERIKRHWEYPPVECPISLAIFYDMPIPKGTNMLMRRKMLKHKIAHTGGPNIDALDAFVVNCLTGILFKNHCQIVQIHSEKHYGWWPQVRILIQTVKG